MSSKNKRHESNIRYNGMQKKKKKILMKKIEPTFNEKNGNKKFELNNENIVKEIEELSTVSIALPGSILENAQSSELRTYLAGQIARAACIFQVDEIIIYDDCSKKENGKKLINCKISRQCCMQLARILQYLECPQYLRKYFFPIHNDLKYAGVLNPLDAPHHLRQNDSFLFREGVVTNKPAKSGSGSQVNVGLKQTVQVDKLLTTGLRCTVKLLLQNENKKKLKGVVVSPSAPRIETGIYWGYSVRIANSFAEVFSQSPYKNGYDLIIGTSDKGSSINDFQCPQYQHLLIMFGGLQGLEAAIENDDVFNIGDPRLLYDFYLNTLPYQGARTIRTEEAVLISLTALKPKLSPKVKSLNYISTQISFVNS